MKLLNKIAKDENHSWNHLRSLKKFFKINFLAFAIPQGVAAFVLTERMADLRKFIAVIGYRGESLEYHMLVHKRICRYRNAMTRKHILPRCSVMTQPRNAHVFRVNVRNRLRKIVDRMLMWPNGEHDSERTVTRS